ncbi:MAG TPA: hypothetical protein VFJ10_12750 [Acidobacteriaceae bacterium]|nr:hypothetical protein [Acidobacteriaceae bacterium]
MSTLNLFEPAPLSSLEPEKPAQPKSAALAFLISLVLPGSGQMYAGRRSAAAWTMVFFFGSAFLATSLLTRPRNLLGDTGLGVAVALYPFAFLDAYFSVLEYNAGISTYLIGSNPRIAGILNFLTNGIGYFYLGERAKGIIMFIGLGLIVHQGLARAFPNSGGVTLAWLIVQTALAFDAYRLARKQLLNSFPQLEGHSWKAAASGQLSPAVPITLALVLCTPIVGLSTLGLLMKGAGSIEGGDTAIVPDGVRYTNRAYGMTVTFPAGWSVEAKGGELRAAAAEGNCSVLLLREAQMISPTRYQRMVEEQISRKEGFSVHDHGSSTLDGRPAVAMRVSVGTHVEEQIITARSGFSLYSLITVARDDADTCPTDLTRAAASLHFSR